MFMLSHVRTTREAGLLLRLSGVGCLVFSKRSWRRGFDVTKAMELVGVVVYRFEFAFGVKGHLLLTYQGSTRSVSRGSGRTSSSSA